MRASIGFACLALAACEPPVSDVDGGRRDFVAFQGDLAPYATWESFHLDSPFDGGSVHASGPRTEYLNHRPPAGSSSFPVGTIIVKVFDDDGTTFAMVKRGDDYNTSGAAGWEWFELSSADAGAVSIVWRGVGPPSGETYGGDPTACNACHRSYGANDSVPSPALQLGDL